VLARPICGVPDGGSCGLPGGGGSDSKNKRSTIILTSVDGTPWTSDGFRASWGKACAKAGVVGVTFNDRRFNGGRTRTRTLDPLIKSQLLHSELCTEPNDLINAKGSERTSRELGEPF
jgi:hypothetical protein